MHGLRKLDRKWMHGLKKVRPEVGARTKVRSEVDAWTEGKKTRNECIVKTDRQTRNECINCGKKERKWRHRLRRSRPEVDTKTDER